ncbi:hypothetical protein DL98DRAFT_520449, partial [Cadophora sp. DSE1049]
MPPGKGSKTPKYSYSLLSAHGIQTQCPYSHLSRSGKSNRSYFRGKVCTQQVMSQFPTPEPEDL